MPLQSAKKLIETLRSEGTLLLFAKLNLKKGKERFSSPIQCYQWETTNPNFKWRGGGGEGRDVDCFVFRSYPILGLSPRDFVANWRYSRGSENQWYAEEQGTQRAKHNSHFYENQG